MGIKIADELTLPNDAVTQTFAQIGRKGAGKTYLASMIAEQMIDAQAQIIVIDPIGNWWGLRVDADGKSKGKEVFIIGGTHGDVPLAAEAGKDIAKLLVEKNVSVVLDISEFRKNERKRFVTDFAEEFYHLKKTNPTPVHIFLEESQKFAPQRVQKDEARMLGAWEDIVRLGRNCGIGCSLISQRPQSINKEVLSQVECLCVLQITGLHERKALEEWIQEAGEDRKIIGTLPSLQRGQGYVWSPAWLRIFKKLNFLKKKTFDTSATPELGKATKTAKISKMDVKKLQQHMITVIEKAKKETLDKKVLIDEINRLKREIVQKPKQMNEIHKIDDRAIEKAKKEGFYEATRLYKVQTDDLQRTYNIMKKTIVSVQKIVEQRYPEIKLGGFNFPPEIKKPLIKPTTEIGKPLETGIISPVAHITELPSEDEKITGGAMRMLKAAAMFHPNSISRARMGAIAGMSYKSGSFTTYIATLKRNILIESNGGEFTITDKGLGITGDVELLPTDPETLVNMWANIVKGGASRMLRALAEIYPSTLTREELGQKANISHISGSFTTYIATLKRNGLIKVDGQEITASEELFQ